MLTPTRSDRGASAILVAASLLLLVGMAAVAIDLGAGFNERRQDQTAADLGALSGALAFLSPTSTDNVANEVLAIVEENLDTSYSPSDWETLWSACTDSGALNPVAAPSSWGASTLQCISADYETLRVRIPTQIIDTALGGAIGFDTLSTSAVAEAKLQFIGGGHPKPFGLLNSLPAGETCLTQPATGQAMDACDGSASGNFGTILSDTWNLYGDTVVDCGTPGAEEVALAVAIGLDHPVGTVHSSLIPGAGGAWQAPPAADTRLDACSPSGSVGVPSDNSPNTGPVNTVLASTGNNLASAVEKGLVTGEAADFPNAQNPANVDPLLTQTGFVGEAATRKIVQKITGTNYEYTVDNTPLWWYLRDFNDIKNDSGSDFESSDRVSVQAVDDRGGGQPERRNDRVPRRVRDASEFGRRPDVSIQ